VGSSTQTAQPTFVAPDVGTGGETLTFKVTVTDEDELESNNSMDIEEQGPAGNDPNYDGNDDGVADSLQNNVASLHTNDDRNYVTIESPAGTSISKGGATTVRLHLVDGLSGDDDLMNNGIIVDVGGPGNFAAAGDIDSDTDGADGSGGHIAEL